MKRALPVIFLLFITSLQLQAQRKTMILEPQDRKINQGNPLPIHSDFDIRVPVTEETGIIRINVFKGGKVSDVIQRINWTRPMNFSGNFADLPVDVMFKSNSKYGFDVSIYTLLSDEEISTLNALIHQNISNYLNAVMETGSKSIDIEKNVGSIINDLNTLVQKNLTWYKNTQDRRFEGFSDIVKLKLQQVEKMRLANAGFNVVRTPADSLRTQDEIKAMYASQVMNDLREIIFSEVDNYLNLSFARLYDSFVIANRITERSQTVLPLFIGYGGVYLGGNVANLEYDSRPYAGFSFPIGRGNETHYGRTSFILGIFLSNLKDGEGNTITGPIVGRPVFAGLGFRIYDFINLNAGMVATSTEKQSFSTVKTQDIRLQPFIGLNAQFNLWLGLNKK